jgi:hypothetical protein
MRIYFFLLVILISCKRDGRVEIESNKIDSLDKIINCELCNDSLFVRQALFEIMSSYTSHVDISSESIGYFLYKSKQWNLKYKNYTINDFGVLTAYDAPKIHGLGIKDSLNLVTFFLPEYKNFNDSSYVNGYVLLDELANVVRKMVNINIEDTQDLEFVRQMAILHCAVPLRIEYGDYPENYYLNRRDFKKIDEKYLDTLLLISGRKIHPIIENPDIMEYKNSIYYDEDLDTFSNIGASYQHFLIERNSKINNKIKKSSELYKLLFDSYKQDYSEIKKLIGIIK